MPFSHFTLSLSIVYNFCKHFVIITKEHLSLINAYQLDTSASTRIKPKPSKL